MKRISILAGILILVTAVVLTACSGGDGDIWYYPTNTPRQPVVEVTEIPSPEGAVRAYLTAWQAFEYDKMYALLSSLSRDAQTKEKFTDYYQKMKSEATLHSLDFTINAVTVTPTEAEVTYDITLHTILVGDITRSTRMLMKYQDNGWKVAWDEATILPEMKGGNSLRMFRDATARGNIYDRNGLALASMADEVISIGIVSGNITDAERLVSTLFQVMHIPQENIREMIDYDHPDWYIPIGNISKEDAGAFYGTLMSTGGIQVNIATDTRYYYGGGVASNVVGYVGQPSKEQLSEYKSLGYAGDELIGKVGLEASQEEFLAGRPGGTLQVVSQTGVTVATLARSDPVPGMSIYTTLDRNLQEQMEHTLMGPYNGAAVVLKRDTGEVLAMMSSPTYDSNLFNPDNENFNHIQTMIFDNTDNPLLNRATLGSYPLGSVFKIITMSAGLESGRFTPDTIYNDTGYFTELEGFVGTAWTVERNMTSVGKITMVQALERSSNPYFWHVGLDLYYYDTVWRVPDMARSFGLGSLTGIGVIDEVPGFVPDAAWKKSKGEEWTGSDALQQAIGQGELQVTPLQVADFGAALGNGGTLYQPQLILKIQPPIGAPVFTFEPKVRGTLPVKPETLAAIQEGMLGVVNNPHGTARQRLLNVSSAMKIAGKTGTAQTGYEKPHSWFVSYTNSDKPNKPDIAIAVLVEYAGEGSTYAAPMTGRIIEIYLYGSPKARYGWESDYGVRATATPEVTEEPTAETTAILSP